MTLEYNITGTSLDGYDFSRMQQTSDAGGAVTDVAGFALSTAVGMPFLSGLVSSILGGLDKDISAVLKYGFSSWGASWTPEKAKALWGEKVLPGIQAKIENLPNGDLEENINRLYLEIQANYQEYKRLSGSFTAKSSREAMKWASDEMKKVERKIFDNNIIAELKKAGVKVTKESFKTSPGNISGINYLYDHPLDHVEQYTFYRYKFDASGVKVNEKGEVREINKGGGFATLLGLLAVGFFGMKSMK